MGISLFISLINRHLYEQVFEVMCCQLGVKFSNAFRFLLNDLGKFKW